MKVHFQDVLSKLGEPLWYTVEGYPRYCQYHPTECDIYAKMGMLAEYPCQACGRKMIIGTSWWAMNEYLHHYTPSKLQEIIDHKDDPWWVAHNIMLAGGDPPAHGCVGDTMMMESGTVLELWHEVDNEWVKLPLIESLRRLP